jgi:hypothetical protein
VRAAESYELAFSTYFGGSDWEHARDVCVDREGNIYVVGGTASKDFPTTAGAYCRRFSGGGTQTGSFGECDVFVAKFSPAGKLIWSTLLGGPNYDRAYAVAVDRQGYVFVGGRAGPDFPVTPGALQSSFQGPRGPAYGAQNAFVAKLKPDGSALVWCSYLGVGEMCRDLALNDIGDVYVPLGYSGTGPTPPAQWFHHAFQKVPKGGHDCGAAKIKGDGSKVLWATWLGGSADDREEACLRLGADGCVHMLIQTKSLDMPTPGAGCKKHSGGWDLYAAKLTPDGSKLDFGAYFGGSGDEALDTHNLALDAAGNIYFSVRHTRSKDLPTTLGAFQPKFAGGVSDVAVAKLSPKGALLACTYLGGSGGQGNPDFGGSGDENTDGICVDDAGNVLLTGMTSCADFPVTRGALQSKFSGNHDAVIVWLSADFNRLIYSTYMGGPNFDLIRACFLGSDGSVYVAGSSDGPGWPMKNAIQPAFAGRPKTKGYNWGTGDCVVAKLRGADKGASTLRQALSRGPARTGPEPIPGSSGYRGPR